MVQVQVPASIQHSRGVQEARRQLDEADEASMTDEGIT